MADTTDQRPSCNCPLALPREGEVHSEGGDAPVLDPKNNGEALVDSRARA